jgi:hypothetical protein
MNFNYPSQIKSLLNQLNPDFPGFYYKEKINDPFPYIKEKTKLVYFINSDFYKYKVKIPYLISKLELYSIAELYKSYKNTKMILIYKNEILNEDDSSINEISDGGNIIIIENRNYPDISDYISLKKKYEGKEKMNIIFENEHLKFYITISLNDSISDMINSIGYNYKDFRFIFSSINMNEMNIQKLENSNNSICMSDKNVDFYHSVVLSGNEKVKEIINKFKYIKHSEYLRFIFNGERLTKNDKITIAPIYFPGQLLRRNLILSGKVKISEMIKSYNLLYGYFENDVYFLFNASKLYLNDETTIKSKFSNSLVTVYCLIIPKLNNNNIYGKKITANFSVEGKDIFIKIGTLNSTKYLFNLCQYYKRDIKKIFIDKIEINKDDEKSLYSYGIKNNFKCKLI